MERTEITGRYLQALGLQKHDPGLAFLTEIAKRHVETFAFSSVGPRLGDDLPLDLPSLYDRIVVRRRGGYCFEQNGLLYEVLEELGYAVELYLCRVIHNQDIHPGLTHRITVVGISGHRYVVDVGFGSLGPRTPVAMPNQEPAGAHNQFKVAEPRPGQYHMQVYKDEDFYSLYRFEIVRYGAADCELGHFYSHKHPKATFVTNLVVSLVMEGEVRSLRNLEYWVVSDAGSRKQTITDASQLRSVLGGDLGVRITEAESRYLFEHSP